MQMSCKATRALYNEDIRGCTHKSIYKLHNLPHFISCSSSSTARNTAELAKLPSGLLTCSATAILQRQKKDDYININLLRAGILLLCESILGLHLSWQHQQRHWVDQRLNNFELSSSVNLSGIVFQDQLKNKSFYMDLSNI
uniref:Uncharacterized protein n=1 Tax=Glossina palpalis gambiensis TaxID=67801 RepID=A0A1B0B939_9MUSC